jgi:hypothetical protein
MHDIPHKVPPQAIVHLVSKPRALFSSIIKITPPRPKDETYEQLPCTDFEKECVREIITTLGTEGKLTLLFMQGHLWELGAKIEQVHPLKFLASIFAYPDLKLYMVEIFDDYFKRTGFMDGLSPNLDIEAKKGRLDQYINGFALEINVDPAIIRPYFESREWEELVYALIKT